MIKRQIILDTETTGLSTKQGHRITEIGALEMIDRKLTGKYLHYYINPERNIDKNARQITGLNEAFLANKPKFIEIVDELMSFIKNAELIMHNASFDLNFINHELVLATYKPCSLNRWVTVFDTLNFARQLHPGQKNNLDALVARYQITHPDRTYHGALLDAQILADVYLSMTAGQASLNLDEADDIDNVITNNIQFLDKKIKLNITKKNTRLVKAKLEELQQHKSYLNYLLSLEVDQVLWGQLEK